MLLANDNSNHQSSLGNQQFVEQMSITWQSTLRAFDFDISFFHLVCQIKITNVKDMGAFSGTVLTVLCVRVGFFELVS